MHAHVMAAMFSFGHFLELMRRKACCRSVELLQEDLIALQPTLFIAPPRVWDRVYASAMARVRGSNFLRRLIFNYAYRYKLRMLKQGYNWNKASSCNRPVHCNKHQKPPW